LGFPGGSAGKKSVCNLADLGSISGFRRSPGEEKVAASPSLGTWNTSPQARAQGPGCSPALEGTLLQSVILKCDTNVHA